MEDGVKLSERDWKGQGTEGERARARKGRRNLRLCPRLLVFRAAAAARSYCGDKTIASPAQPSQAKPASVPFSISPYFCSNFASECLA